LLVIVAGHIDLSVGSVVGYEEALAAVMLVHWDLPTLVVIPCCLLVGIAIGAAQGYWIAYWRIPSFIVTLAGMLVFRGASLWLLAGQSVGPFPRQFQALSTGFIPDLMPFVKELFGLERMNGFAVVTGIVIAGLIVWMGLRSRARNRTYGMSAEPMSFFIIRNLLVAGAI